MRTSEFKKAVGLLGYETCTDQNFVNVLNGSARDIICISNNMEFSLTNCSLDFSFISKDDKKRLFELSVEYASTPIAEREEEKRYRLKLINKTVHEGVSYLNEITSDGGKYFLSSNVQFVKNIRNVFTESELSHIDETGFKRVEVTE